MPIPFDLLQRARIHLLDRPVRRTHCGVALARGSLTRTVDIEEVYKDLDEFLDSFRDHMGDHLKAELGEPLMKEYICEFCLAEAVSIPLTEYKTSWLYRWRHPLTKAQENEQLTEREVVNGP